MLQLRKVLDGELEMAKNEVNRTRKGLGCDEKKEKVKKGQKLLYSSIGGIGTSKRLFSYFEKQKYFVSGLQWNQVHII